MLCRLLMKTYRVKLIKFYDLFYERNKVKHIKNKRITEEIVENKKKQITKWILYIHIVF
jgi:hypothetical protein